MTDEKPKVEMIGPSKALRAKIGHHVNMNEVFNEDAIERAQNIIEVAKEDFLKTCKHALESVIKILHKDALTDIDRKKLLQTSQQITGEAETLGYEALSTTLHSLKKYLKNTPTPNETVLRKYADLCSVILQSNQKAHSAESREILQKALPELVEYFHSSGE